MRRLITSVLFVVFVVLAFLKRWSSLLRAENEYTQCMMVLQSLPTSSWGMKEIEELVAQAYVYSSMFASAPHHYKT